MTSTVAREICSRLIEAQVQLRDLLSSTARETEVLTRSFESLAFEARSNVELAAGVVDCVQSENVRSVFEKAEAQHTTAGGSLETRREAIAKIVDALKIVAQKLDYLAGVTRRQQAIAQEFKALSLRTRMEIEKLGAIGSGFEQLARDLSRFAVNILNDTRRLAELMKERGRVIEKCRQVLSADLAAANAQMMESTGDAGSAAQEIGARLSQLKNVPAEFRVSAGQTTAQIDRVVAAVQGQDITRQQIEHVEESLDLMASRMSVKLYAGDPLEAEMPLLYAGLKIQFGQLKNIEETAAHWTSLVQSCVGDIQRMSASEIAGVGSIVLDQERDLSAHLGSIEKMQQASQAHSETVREALRSLSSLLDLMNQYLEQSERIRDGLQVLTWNSVIEAGRLGSQGMVVSVIAHLISEASEQWGAITDQSKEAKAEIVGLVGQTNRLMEAFSEASCGQFDREHQETRSNLDHVRKTAALVNTEAAKMNGIVSKMQAMAGRVDRSERALRLHFSALGSTLNTIETITRQVETDDPGIKNRSLETEAELLFSVRYTTEIERQVMRSALHGAVLPSAQETFAGNSVELF